MLHPAKTSCALPLGDDRRGDPEAMLTRPSFQITLILALQALACGAPLADTPSPRPLHSETRSVGDPQGLGADDFDHGHGLWNDILSRHVRGDGFDYAALKKAPGKLSDYLERLHAVTPGQLQGWSKNQRFAFWINVYNAHTIKKVVDNYPIESIKKLSGAFGLNSVFDSAFIDMPSLHPGGKNKKLSLNDVEHEILRKRFKDARLHAAINCASHSCPPLRKEAFTAKQLDEQLTEQMRLFVNDPKRNVIDTKKNTLRLSKLFDWFRSDFEREAKSVQEYFIRYAPEEKAETLRRMKVRYLSYDWALNEVETAD